MKYLVTHFLIVPNFYKVFIREIGESLRHLKKITLAGESFTEELVKEHFDRLKTAALYNEYGPTENSVCTTVYRFTPNRTQVLIGKPINNVNCYILDQKLELAPIGVPGQLTVSGRGIARGYLNRPELTAEKFDRYLRDSRAGYHRSYRSYTSYIIYKTGDLARWLSDGNIEFLGRIDHQVKIRGYRIELGEIESRLSNYPGLKEVVVVVREDVSDDKYICAYFVSDGEYGKSELREYLSKALPDYMIPAYYVRLDKIPLTPNGKLDRGALPSPGLKVDHGFTAPVDEIEKKLAGIWSEVLEVEKEKISINDNFFHLGGHSLKATIMASIVHKELKVKISLAQIFTTPHIKGLSAYIKTVTGETHTPVGPVEKREYYVLSTAQERLYTAQRMNLENTAYNLPALYPLPGWIDTAELETYFNKLINRHESLRTSFHMIDDEPVQRIEEKVEFKIKVEEEQSPRSEGTRGLAPLPVEPASGGPQPAAALISSFIRPFDLSQAPLLRVGLIEREKPGGRDLLIVDMHHIISDEISLNTMLKEFLAAAAGEELAPLPIQYKDYARWQKLEQTRQTIQRQSGFWLRELKEKIPEMHLPLDFPRPDHFYLEGNTLTFILDSPQDRELKKLTKEENVTLFILLLTIFNVMLAKICGQEGIVVGTVAAGRPHADLRHILGFFVNQLVLVSSLKKEKTFTQYLKEVKTRVLAAFENQDYPLEELVEQLEIKRKPGRHPLFDVVFTLNRVEIDNDSRDQKEPPGEIAGEYRFQNTTAKYDLVMACLERGDSLSFSIEYAARLFKEETIRRFIGYFKEITAAVLQDKHIRLEDIQLSSHLVKTETGPFHQNLEEFEI